MDVSPAQWLAVATFVFLAALASRQLGSIWRREQTRNWPLWWARSLPACIAVGWMMIVALPVELFVISWPEPVSAWLVLILAIVLLLVGAALVIAVSVMLIGHPRRLVPPHLRNDAKRH